jgi:hypothetical protein
MNIERLSLSEWATELPETGHQVFHRPELLELLAEHSDTDELRLYAGLKGDHLVGLLPVFLNRNRLGIRTISSPPPGMHVPYLGVVLQPTSPKVRKCERVNTRFTRGVLDDLGINNRSLVFLVNGPEYTDPRPYEWEDLSIETSFTYRLPIDGRSAEEIMRRFSKSRRREIRKGEDLDVIVEQGNRGDTRRVFEQTKARFAEQDEYYGLTWPFVRGVVEAIGDKSRTYVARRPDGEFLSGIVVLYSGDTASFWLGGVRKEYEHISINSLLHWAIIRDIADDPELSGITNYDMVGAGEYRLSKFKSKFGPELCPYYVINSGGVQMWASESAYSVLKNVRTWFQSTPERRD